MLYILMLMRGKRGITKAQFKRDYDPETRKQRKLNVRQKRQVKTIVSRKFEPKAFQAQAAPAAISTTAQIVHLSPIAQGNSNITRVGNMVELKSIESRIHLITNAASFALMDIFNFVRVIVFQWKDNVVPVATDLLLNGSSGVVDVGSLYNHDNRNQFKIVSDNLMRIMGDGVNGSTSKLIDARHNMSFGKGILSKLEWVGNSVTNGYNQLYILLVSDSSATPHPLVYITFKLIFKDG